MATPHHFDGLGWLFRLRRRELIVELADASVRLEVDGGTQARYGELVDKEHGWDVNAL